MGRKIALLVILCCLLAAPALAENRVLLVGCDRFLTRQDTFPASEGNTRSMAEVLTGGLMAPARVLRCQDSLADSTALAGAVAEAFAGAQPGDVSYLYLSTHGLWLPEQSAEETAPPEEAPVETADVSGAQLNRSDFTLSVKGEKYTIKLSGTEATPRWSIDNPNVATIAGDGTVTAVANGNTTVHCKVGNRDLTCTVRVRGTGSTAAPADAPMVAEPITPVAPPQPTTQTPAANTATNTDANVDVSGAQLNRKDFTLSRGEKFTVKLSGTTAVPRWDVDDPNVAVVNENGVVTGVGSGTTTLHCKVGNRDLTCIVRVK